MAKIITIKNTSKAVKVLKSVGLLPLRLFPGYNQVDEVEANKHFKSNAVCRAIRDDDLELVKNPTQEMEEQALAAKKKNDDLNRAKKILQKKDEALLANKETISKQDSTIQKQNEKISEQTKTLEKQSKLLIELADKVAALEKDITGSKDTKK